jgi:hypothetical protein
VVLGARAAGRTFPRNQTPGGAIVAVRQPGTVG